MSIFAIILMWIWFVVVYVIWSQWPMGDESDRRGKYWARFED